MLESPINYEQKSICCFLVDTSGSMEGDKIDALNAGLAEFYKDILKDSVTANRLEIALVEFNDTARTRVNPGLAEVVAMPTLNASGGTDLEAGIKKAVSVIQNRKTFYKDTGQPYSRPWIILITDGEPDRSNNIDYIRETIRDGVDNKSFIFLSIGVQNANMQVLSGISHPEFPPMKLHGLKFAEFFKWVSASMCIVTDSSEDDFIALPPTNNWIQGFKL